MNRAGAGALGLTKDRLIVGKKTSLESPIFVVKTALCAVSRSTKQRRFMTSRVTFAHAHNLCSGKQMRAENKKLINDKR